MTSPYLDRPLLPLAVALPRMLEKIEAELADENAGAAEKWRLRQRRVGSWAAHDRGSSGHCPTCLRLC